MPVIDESSEKLKAVAMGHDQSQFEFCPSTSYLLLNNWLLQNLMA